MNSHSRAFIDKRNEISKEKHAATSGNISFALK